MTRKAPIALPVFLHPARLRPRLALLAPFRLPARTRTPNEACGRIVRRPWPRMVGTALALTLGSGACASLSIQVVEHGQYEPRAESRQLAAGSTAAGHVHEVEALRDPVLIAASDRIVARRGARFGVKLRVKGSPSFETLPVRVRVLHPPITHPTTGQVSDREEWDARLNIGIPRFTGWSFDEDWEMAPGAWTIQVVHRGKVLAQQGFTVSVEPGSEPE